MLPFRHMYHNVHNKVLCEHTSQAFLKMTVQRKPVTYRVWRGGGFSFGSALSLFLSGLIAPDCSEVEFTNFLGSRVYLSEAVFQGLLYPLLQNDGPQAQGI